MVYLAVDTGATNTTVWLVHGRRILRQVRRPVGVRSTSISGSRAPLQQALRETLLSLAQKAPSPPRFVLAAGMLTSSLGLLEIPHVVAPADAAELSRHVRMKTLAEVSPVPFFFVPGVRIQRAPSQLDSLERTDIIRGEETEIVGLLARKNFSRPWLFLHLGSHAKAIRIDARGRIIRSTTTLSGECLHVLRTQTILANRLGTLKSARLAPQFFEKGYRYARRNGLLRALFMVRLLEDNIGHSPAELYSFLLGALVSCDLQAFERQGLLKPRGIRILLSGQAGLLTAWSLLLRRRKHRITIVRLPERAAAFLAGLRTIVFASPVFRRFLEREQRRGARVGHNRGL